MTDYRSVMELELRRVGPPTFTFFDLSRRRDRKRRNQRITAGALALALTAAGAFGLVRGLASRSTEPASGASTIVDEIPIQGARSVTVGAGSVWVRGEGDIIQRIDPSTNTIADTLSGPRHGSDVTFSGGELWVLGDRQGLSGIDPGTGQVKTFSSLYTFDAVVAVGSLWVPDHRPDRKLGRVARVDPETGVLTSSIAVPGAECVTFAYGSIWTSSAEPGVVRVDPSTNAVVATIPTGSSPCPTLPGSFASSPYGLWVAEASLTNNRIERIDPATNTVTTVIRLPASAQPQGGIVFDGTSLWGGMND